MLKSVRIRASRLGSGEQHIACGELTVSEKKRALSSFTSTSPIRPPGRSSPMSSSQIAFARESRTGEPDSHGGSSMSVFARK